MEIPRTLILGAFAAGAAYFDFRHRIVPNRLVFLCLIAGIALAASGGRSGLSEYGLGLLLGLAILLPAFILRMVGGGDVKSLAVVGILTGPHLLWVSFLRASMIAGCVAVPMVLCRLVRSARLVGGAQARERQNSRGSIPYAGILVLTAFLSLFV